MGIERKKLKVLIVDDSRTFRSLLHQVISSDPWLECSGSAWNGNQALEIIRNNPPDLVTLDVEMPEKNGLETLREIQEINSKLAEENLIGVIMVSSMTQHGAQITLQALELGAFDFVPKPENLTLEENLDSLKLELLEKISGYASKRPWSRKTSSFVLPKPYRTGSPAPEKKKNYKAILIGASTGGPKALLTLIPILTENVVLPILVANHMPPFFTSSLAESLDKKCRYSVIECKGDERLASKQVYIAPGGKHLLMRRMGEKDVVTVLTAQPSEDGCCPSVNKLFRSGASVFGGEVIAIVLTGMGTDGTNGLGPLKRAGAFVIAQDEKTSVVWGMPGSAVASGFVDKISPLEKIPHLVKEQIRE